MEQTACIILAAGRGTRMRSETPKPLHKLHGRFILTHLVDTVNSIGISKTALVLGHGSEEVKKKFNGIKTIKQKKQLGSGDAVKSAVNSFKGFSGDILVLYSDTPLLGGNTLKRLIKKHKDKKAGCSFLTVNIAHPKGYGRIIRDVRGEVIDIVEEKSATKQQKRISEINVGAYVFKAGQLAKQIGKIKINKKKKEYYLTDIVRIFRDNGEKIATYTTDNLEECMGINSRVELAKANEILKRRVLNSLMRQGVTIVDPATTNIDREAKIGRDTVIFPNTVIEKNVIIGKKCQIGPFARLRPGTVLKDTAEVGTFVEIVRTIIGEGTKVKHKTYLGDAVLGKNINVGAGTITANYDGKNKNKTRIKDGAFIGIGSRLVAPVTIGKKAVVGAGSVVTKHHNVPDNSTVVGVPARIFKK